MAMIANPQCGRCRGFGELCTGSCDQRVDEDLEDVLAVAQYAKTYADGPVWEAACRVLSRHTSTTTEPTP